MNKCKDCGSENVLVNFYGEVYYCTDCRGQGKNGWKNKEKEGCECGTHKVYGKDAPSFYHSFWCPLYEQGE